MKTISLALLMVLSTIGCAHREKILDANWISMKNSDFPQESQVTKVASVETTFCLEANSGHYGAIDETVKKAEQDYKIDYIRNASFYHEAEVKCYSVSGEGYRKK